MAASTANLKVILVGQSAFAEKCLETILAKDGVSVIAVYTNLDSPERPEPVRVLAEGKSIPVHQHKSLKATDAAFKEWTSYAPDLVILAFVTQYVPDNMITIPRIGTVCFHGSLLPKYRGGSAIQWQLANGERKGGLSWFWTLPAKADKVDDGPICVQKEIDISDTDTAATLYFQKLFPLGVETCGEVVDLCLKGDPPRLTQDESQATWQPLCNDKTAKIDWSKPCGEIYNLLRGADPQPGAHTFYKEQKVRLFGAKVAPDASGAPGTVLEVGAAVTVACGQGGVTLTKMRAAGAKVSAQECSEALGLQVGDVFA